MSFRDSDESKIAAANLLDNYREQWNENFEQNKIVSAAIDDYIFNLLNGNAKKNREIIKILNEAIMLTPANRDANKNLAERVKAYIRHIARKRPKATLTHLHLRSIQQSYVDSISAHFVHQHGLVSMVLVEVFSNVSVVTRSRIIPNSIREEIDNWEKDKGEYKEEEEDKDD